MKLRLLDKLHLRIGENHVCSKCYKLVVVVWDNLLLLSDPLHMQLAGENGTMCLSGGYVYH